MGGPRPGMRSGDLRKSDRTTRTRYCTRLQVQATRLAQATATGPFCARERQAGLRSPPHAPWQLALLLQRRLLPAANVHANANAKSLATRCPAVMAASQQKKRFNFFRRCAISRSTPLFAADIAV